MKVRKGDFSSGGCQKLPNWVKITHQNAEKYSTASPEEKKYNFFYSITQL